MSDVPKSVARVLLSGNTYSAALSALAAVRTPVTDATIGRAVVRMGDSPTLAVMFAGTAAENKDFSYRVIGLMEATARSQETGGEGLLPVLLAQGAVTLGATAVGAGGTFVEAATSLFADTITDTLDTGYVSVHSPANNRVAVLTVNASMFRYVAIDITTSGASAAPTTMDVIAMRGCDDQMSLVTAATNIGNVGILNAAETEVNPAVSVVEDAAHSSGEAINPSAAVRTDTRASLAGTTGDWAPLQLNANGELRVRSDDTCKGLVVPQADVTVDAGVATYEAAITIPAGVLAVRMYLDAAMYCVVDNTAGNPAATGAPVPADRLIDIPCVGCTKLHVAQVAGNVALKHSFVYAS